MGARILDLTETNPTRVGLSGAGAWEILGLTAESIAAYDPDPQGSRTAREAIAKYYLRRGVPDGTADDLLLTSSTSEAYAHLFRILCEPGDEILVPRPSYPLFEPLAMLEDVRVEHYRLAYHEGWSLDRDSLEAAISKRTRAIVMVQPNNPTGSLFSAEDASAVLALAAERGIAILSDEVFADFPWTPGAHPIPSIAADSRALTFVLGGLSKSCGLPQMKVAWILTRGPRAAREEAMRRLGWVGDLFLSVSAPAQAAVPGFLAGMPAFQKAVRERLERNLGLLSSHRSFRLLRADGGWSAVLAIPDTGGDFASIALERADVLVHPGHFYELEDRFIVVSLLTPASVLDEALARLENL